MASPAPSPAPSYTSEPLSSATPRRRRPGSARGVALSCLVLLTAAAVAGCVADPVRIDAGDLDGADLAACEALLDALPDELADEGERELDPDNAVGAAYGDPPIVVTCVDQVPEGFAADSVCEQVNDVGWFIPDDQVADPDSDAVLTAMTHRPFVQLTVPAEHRPDGAAAALAEVSELIEVHLDLAEECL